MRILYLANNWLGWQILQWLNGQGEDVVGLVIHPPAKQKFVQEMLQAAAPASVRVFDGSQLQHPVIQQQVRDLQPDIGVSVLFDYVLKADFLALFPHGVINLHPALLPYNRGQYPNVWSIVEGTPSGTTLHFVNEGIDTGDIIAQQEVAVEPVDTGESLYRKLDLASVELFQQTWPLVKAGQAPRCPQKPGGGTCHRTRDVEKIDAIDLDKTCRAGDLINILRARTFSSYKGAYFSAGGRKVYVRVQLEYGEEPR